MFEPVHTMTDYYDGPRRGVADFQGRPHLYESEWGDGADLACETFLLTPVDGETFAMATESWSLWRRWEAARRRGEVTAETHPALPEDRPRYDELEALLAARLVTDPAGAVRKRGEFRVRPDGAVDAVGWRLVEVRWSDQTDPSFTDSSHSPD